MKLRSRLSEYAEMLPARVGNARHVWSERAGILITLEDEVTGERGRGEAAPLPGYSEHTLEACRDALSSLELERLASLTAEALLSGELQRTLPDAPPEARFAIESACLELFARRARQPLHRLLRAFLREAAPLEPLELTALVGPELESWEDDARRALASGYRGVKVKVGRPGRLGEELRGLELLQAVLAGAPLRLDANGSLAPADLPRFSQFGAEFLEEPLPSGASSSAPRFVPIALDESLRALELRPGAAWLDSPGVVAWVLKLGALGGFSRALALAEVARSRGIELVPSHTFESAVGYAGAAELALALGRGRFAAGLAPYAGLAGVAALQPPRLVPHSEPGLGVALTADG